MSLGFRTDLALLELGGTSVEDHGDHLVIRSPHNPTHWWGNFLLLERVPEPGATQLWLDRFAAAFPVARHVALGFDGTDGCVADLAGFTAHQLPAQVQTVMTATALSAQPPLNPSAVCRELSTDDDWTQSVELRMRCDADDFDPIAHRPFVTAKAQTNRALVAAGHGAYFGAFIDGRLTAQLGVFRAGFGLARYQAVETDPDYRRRGLARSLVHHAGRFGLDVLGVQTLVMVADPDYFAIDLYRAVGFTAAETELQVERAPGRTG